jgi:hypothetical protein
MVVRPHNNDIHDTSALATDINISVARYDGDTYCMRWRGAQPDALRLASAAYREKNTRSSHPVQSGVCESGTVCYLRVHYSHVNGTVIFNSPLTDLPRGLPSAR